MKKILNILFIALLGAVSCTLNDPVSPDQESGKVTLMMKVSFPETFVVTKGDMGIQPSIDNIYVAVFGTEHYLNDYVKAVPCKADGTTDGASFAGIENDKDFYFKVTLTATQTKRYVHIIANGPDHLDFNTYEDEIMKKLTTEGTKAAYWTYLVLPNGTANADGTAAESALNALNGIRLVRNFARVHLAVAETVENFTLTGYEVFNTPTHGSIAIWNAEQAGTVDEGNSGYYPSYHTETFDNLWSNYSAFMPNDEIDATKPSASGTYTTGDKFIFERPDRATDRPYIIIKGRYSGDGADTFYRLDFVDRDGNYLPIFRNFEYKVILTSVAKSGVADPASAKASNSNVSSITETQDLADLADGVSRIYVEWLDQTYMGAGTQTFHYMYLKDAANDTQSTQAKLEIIDGAGQAIDGNLTQSGPETEGGFKNWHTVTFKTTAAATSGEKKTVFRVTGSTDDGQKLYRTITVHVLPSQSWGTPTVSSEGSAIGRKVTVTFTLPTGLPSSIFPLEIEFEDSQKKLNPNGTDMPAKVGTSIVSGNTNTSYQFVKSVSYLEYAGEGGSNVLKCEFKRISTGATTLYFKNKYFNSTNAGSVAIPAN